MRLIDADAYAEVMKKYYPKFWQTVLNDAPTIDAVPVVRCKDCKWYQDNTSWENVVDNCKWISTETPDEGDFCSCGERKDND